MTDPHVGCVEGVARVEVPTTIKVRANKPHPQAASSIVLYCLRAAAEIS